MIRKAFIIGTVALGMAIGAVAAAPGVNRFVSSARMAHHYLKSSDNSLNPVERFVFSLVLANKQVRSCVEAAAGNHS